jgi:hypothetical protein
MTTDALHALLALAAAAFIGLTSYGFGISHGRALERRHGRVQRSLRMVRDGSDRRAS